MNIYDRDQQNSQADGIGNDVGRAADEQKKRNLNSLIFFVIIVVAFLLYSTLTGSGSIQAAVDDNTLGVSGPNKTTHFIALSDITEVDLLEEFEVGEAIEVTETDNIYLGTYQNDLLGEYSIIAYQSCAAMVVVYTADEVFVFNDTDKSATEEYYNLVTDALEAYAAD